MSKYYYLVAQLPYLNVSSNSVDNLPFSYQNFCELALRFLTEKDAAILKKLSLEPDLDGEKTGSHFLDEWMNWERLMRLAMAQIRAGNMKKTFNNNAFSIPANIQQTAKTVCDFKNPLEAEQFLNLERLKLLDELTPLDGFVSDAVFAYGLKLLLAERIAKFNKEAGVKSYHKIYDEILGDAK